MSLDAYRSGEFVDLPIFREVNQAEIGQKDRRIERVRFETDRHRIVGDVTLPPEGYQSRFSDSLNLPDVTFIPLVNAEVSSLTGGDVELRPFMVVSKLHVRVAFPIESGSNSGATDSAGRVAS